MIRVARAAAATLLLLAGSEGPVLACSGRLGEAIGDHNFKRYAAASPTVLVVHVTEAAEVAHRFDQNAASSVAVQTRFQLIELLRGTAPRDGTIMSPLPYPPDCGLSLPVGLDLVVFLHRDDGVARSDDMFLPLPGGEWSRNRKEFLRDLGFSE